jgi:hypothetical protein
MQIPLAPPSRMACLLAMCVFSAVSVAGSGDQKLSMSVRPGAAPMPAQPAAEAKSLGGSSLVELKYDNGQPGVSIGIVDDDEEPGHYIGAQGVFANRFTPTPDVLPLTIDQVSILFPATNSALSAGMAFQIVIYLGPSDDGDTDVREEILSTQLVSRVDFNLGQPSDTEFQTIVLPTPIKVEQGDVWIGFTNVLTRNDELPIYPAAVDQTATENADRSWIFFHGMIHEHFDGAVLADAAVAGTLSGSSFAGAWMIRGIGQSGAAVELTWEPPEVPGGPARFLEAQPLESKAEVTSDAESALGPAPAPGGIIAYKVYRASASPVIPSPGNLFATVPPASTSLRSSASREGSFFVVTVCYESGEESQPSNEASGGIPAANVTQVKVTPTKIVGKGSGFTTTVEVFVDGIAFSQPAKVNRKRKKVAQKGTLANGQAIGDYVTPGKEVIIGFRNSDGAVANRRFTRP